MHILIAPNAFKNSLDASSAAKAIREGLVESRLNCSTTCFPVADGGDGTGKLLGAYLGAMLLQQQVHDPLFRNITSSFGWIEKDHTAIIELADASGLRLLRPAEYNVLHATTYGTGELIRAAMGKKANTIIICIGGSATVDGGAGMLRALGMELADANGRLLTDLPASLGSLVSVNIPADFTAFGAIEIIVLCDVENTLLGPTGAATVFGPQKGATPEQALRLEEFLSVWNQVTFTTTGKKMADLKHGGAAGGIAAALHTYLGASLVNGIDYFLDKTGFRNELRKADLVITGEGSLDEQTLHGKGPFGVASCAKQYGIPVAAMAGKIEAADKLKQYFDRLITITSPDTDLASALAGTYANLKAGAKELGNDLAG